MLGLAGGVMAHAAPTVLYTDLDSAPAGAFVTVFGQGFAGAAVTGAAVVSQSDSAVVLRWQGTPVTIGDVPVPVVTRAGRVREATPSTLQSVINTLQSGDVVYLRGGNYSGRYGRDLTWGNRTLTLGSYASNTAFIGYPGEVATLPSARLGDNAGMAHGVTFASLNMSGDDCIFGEHYWENVESGARNVRVVNIDCRGTYGSANTMTGLVALGGDGWRILGNRFSNNAPSPINNNHAVYIQVGADDVEVAYNDFRNMRLGHVIQLHTDGPAREYSGIRIHSNRIIGNNPNDMRGIVVSGCTNTSTVRIYNNVLLNVGQDFSGIAVYCGQVEVLHNTLANIAAPPLLMQWGSGFTVTARNNVFIGRANSISSGTLIQSNNITSGTVDSDGRMINTQTAPNVGVYDDIEGQPRGSTVTIGAFESASLPRPNSPATLSVQ
jgi:hypothetical protein